MPGDDPVDLVALIEAKSKAAERLANCAREFYPEYPGACAEYVEEARIADDAVWRAMDLFDSEEPGAEAIITLSFDEPVAARPFTIQDTRVLPGEQWKLVRHEGHPCFYIDTSRALPDTRMLAHQVIYPDGRPAACGDRQECGTCREMVAHVSVGRLEAE